MKRFAFFIVNEMLRKVKQEVKSEGFDSVASFIRKLIVDYFKNKA